MSDTQDEAEKLANEAAVEFWYDGDPGTINQDTRTGFLKGYRAGVASREAEIASLKHDLATKSSTDLISEKYRLREQLAASRAEVEGLKQWGQQKAEKAFILDAELAAEKSRSKKLVGLLREAVEFMKRPPALSTGDRAWHQHDVIIQIDKTLSDYSTDSGDGVG